MVKFHHIITKYISLVYIRNISTIIVIFLIEFHKDHQDLQVMEARLEFLYSYIIDLCDYDLIV